MRDQQVKFSELVGKTIVKIQMSEQKDIVNIETSDGDHYEMRHDQDCCESVTVEDVIGDINDLLNTPVTMAEESISSNTNPEDVAEKDWQDSFTWTFYKLATVKGYVTIRWYGESNGYYSESVDFVKINSGNIYQHPHLLTPTK